MNIKKFILILAAFVLASVSHAQTVITSTTLSAALDATSATFNVTSATGFVAGRVAFVDRELILITTVTGTSIRGIRGFGGIGGTHKSGATIWVQVPQAFRAVSPAGQCVRTNQLYVPWINTNSGEMYDCLGVTTAGQWVRVDAPGPPVLGSTVASATSITPTGTIFTVSGTTNPVTTIVVPAGWAPGNCLNILPSGAFVTDASANIALASTGVVAKLLVMCWNGTDWYPSY